MSDSLFAKITESNKNYKVMVIAEIGSNHDGSLERAKKLMKCAADCGVDAVKFQSFTAEGLLNPIQIKGGQRFENSSYKILQQLATPTSWYPELIDYAGRLGLILLSTPFDNEQAKLLDTFNVPVFKVASSDITNYPFLSYLARFSKTILLSTGLAYMSEVARAVEVIKNAGNNNLVLLHCVSLYPPDFSEVNLKAMITLQQVYQLPVGLSDHTPGDAVPLAAVAMGACVVEKHFTDDRNRQGPDHAFAMEINDFASMVVKIRQLERAMGDGIKRPCEAEKGERYSAFRSMHARIKINKGQKIKEDMVKIVRPVDGIEAEFASMVYGKNAKEDIEQNEPITWDKLI
ncbi:N-acetylneuraminate synthase family protein [Pelotomaculum isophthalicicum JI]|uniref:N-acetylneuraminate synthase family protein n=1 Tax=Pelotomaculum isophthalicicum JI TaxID=947010 RepID=A0A9X4H6T0_9FIRM|nr:N-acetylneuraminate synthase family protein [Pelotomaculum isophthalicicum]MDF9409143.1 N-acetylneuraminate synthase family protein [Pelotomaculum isophthalicicum JI]